MNYFEGPKILAGDQVLLNGDCEGVVAFCIDNDDYSEEFPKAEWEYLKEGFMVKSDRYGLVHHREADEDITFIKRQKI